MALIRVVIRHNSCYLTNLVLFSEYFIPHVGEYVNVLSALEKLNVAILKAMDKTKEVGDDGFHLLTMLKCLCEDIFTFLTFFLLQLRHFFVCASAVSWKTSQRSCNAEENKTVHHDSVEADGRPP